MLIVLAVFTFIVGGIFNNLSQSQIRYQFEQEVAEVQQIGQKRHRHYGARDQTGRLPKSELLR